MLTSKRPVARLVALLLPFAFAACGGRLDPSAGGDAFGGGTNGSGANRDGDAGTRADVQNPPRDVDASTDAGSLDVTCTGGGLQPGSPWPMLGRCPSHRGRSDEAGPTVGAIRWALPLGTWNDRGDGPILSSAAIAADGTIYVLTRLSLVAATPDGTVAWRMPVGEGLGQGNTSPALGADGTIYVGTDGLYAFAPNGNLRWVHHPQPGAWPSATAVMTAPVIGNDGTVYVGSRANDLIAIDAHGRRKWTKNWVGAGQSGFASSPALGADGSLYIGDDRGGLSALGSADGSVKWRADVAPGHALFSAPTLVGGLVAIGGQGELVAFHANDGTVAWRAPVTSSPYTKTILAGPSVAMDGTLSLGGPAAEVLAVDRRGMPVWSAHVGDDPGRGVMRPTLIDRAGVVYAGTADGHLAAVDREGHVMWSLAFDSEISGAPVMGGDGTIYVGTGKGTLYAIGQKP